MKLFALLLCFFSASAFAITEVECTGRYSGTDVRIDIQGYWNQGYYKNALLWLRKNGAATTTRHSLTYRAPWGGVNRAEYTGQDVRVEVDLWPDAVPRWGRVYYGTARLSALNSQRFQIQCRYPHLY